MNKHLFVATLVLVGLILLILIYVTTIRETPGIDVSLEPYSHGDLNVSYSVDVSAETSLTEQSEEPEVSVPPEPNIKPDPYRDLSKELSGATVGSIIYIGRYEHKDSDGNMVTENLEWIVLHKDGQRLLVACANPLTLTDEVEQFDLTGAKIGTDPLSKYLNITFKKYFTPDELKHVSTAIYTSESSTTAHSNMRVSLLSQNEIITNQSALAPLWAAVGDGKILTRDFVRVTKDSVEPSFIRDLEPYMPGKENIVPCMWLNIAGHSGDFYDPRINGPSYTQAEGAIVTTVVYVKSADGNINPKWRTARGHLEVSNENLTIVEYMSVYDEDFYNTQDGDWLYSVDGSSTRLIDVDDPGLSYMTFTGLRSKLPTDGRRYAVAVLNQDSDGRDVWYIVGYVKTPSK